MTEKLTNEAMADLVRLAKDRCREAVMSVGQLVEDHNQRAALLTAVAMDILRGASVMIQETKEGKDCSEREVFDGIVAQLVKATHEKLAKEAKAEKAEKRQSRK